MNSDADFEKFIDGDDDHDPSQCHVSKIEIPILISRILSKKSRLINDLMANAIKAYSEATTPSLKNSMELYLNKLTEQSMHMLHQYDYLLMECELEIGEKDGPQPT